MPSTASRLESLPLSGIREMLNLAAEMQDVLHLEIGEPDRKTPPHITEGAFEWASSNRVGYPPNSGLYRLRELLAEKISRSNGISCEAENVNVTVGATGALYLALLAILENGDDVLVPDPGWAGYPAMVGLAGGNYVPYQMAADNGFKLDIANVELAISPATKAIIVNSPSNPTGVMLDRAALLDLLALAEKHDLWIVADECYDQIVFNQDHISIGALESSPFSRVLSCFSFSKTYAMTGWRLGYLACAKDLAASVTKMQAAVVASASAVSQVAGQYALQGSQQSIDEMVGDYEKRRDSALPKLNDAGIGYTAPDGALYIWVDIRPTGLNSKDFCINLLKSMNVCTTPGSAFGSSGEGYVRLSLACADDEFAEGLRRFAQFYSECR